MATLAEQFYQNRALEAAQAQQLAAQQAQAQAQAEADALAARNAPRSWGTALLQDLPLQLASGGVGLGQAAYGAVNMGSLGLLERINPVDMAGNFQQTQRGLLGYQSPQTQDAVQRVSEGYDKSVTQGLAASLNAPYLQNLVASNLPSLLPGAAAARVGAARGAVSAIAEGLAPAQVAARAGTASTRALERMVGGQVAGATNIDTINAIREQGGSETEQQLGGVGAGLLAGAAGVGLMRVTGAGRFEAGAANALPGGVVTGQTNRGLVTEGVAGLAREGTEESLQSASEQLAQNIFTPNVGLFDGVGQAFGTGLVAGGVLGGGMGATISMTTPRASDSTPLGQTLRNVLSSFNRDAGSPLAPSGLDDGTSPLAGVVEVTELGAPETIDLGETPLPAEPLAEPTVGMDSGGAPLEEIDLGATPTPVRSLYDITGRLPQVTPAAPGALPQMGVEELAPPQRPGLLGVIDAQRGRGSLAAGFDLAGAPLPVEGAFPQAPAAGTPTPTPTTAPEAQAALDFDTVPTLKKTMTQVLGVKPAALRGKAWSDFEAAAAKAGVGPTSPELESFLRQYVPTLGDSDTGFAGAMQRRFAAPAEAPAEAQAAPTEVQSAQANDAAPTQGAEPGDRGGVNTPPPPAAFDDTGVLAEASRGDNEVELGRLGSLVASGVVTQQEAARVVERASRAARIARDRAVAGDYIQEYVANATGADYNYASTVGRYEAADVADLDYRKARKAIEAKDAQIEHAEEVIEAASIVDQSTQVATPGSVPPEPAVTDSALQRDLTRTIKRAMADDPSETHESAAAFAISDLLMDAPGIEELNQYYLAAKALPIYRDLSPALRKDIDDNFSRIHTHMESGEGAYSAKFDRAEGGTPKATLPTQQFEQLVERANQLLGQTHPSQRSVFGVETVADFEMVTGQAAPSDARGAFVHGKTYLIHENIASKKDFAFVLAHERGHKGLTALLGDRLPAVVNRLWTNPATRTRIQAKMRALDPNATDSQGSLRRQAGEEVLADMLAGGEKLNGDVLTKARAAIDTAFSTLLGTRSLHMTNAEVDALLRDTAAVNRGQSPASLLADNPPHLQGLQFLMADPNEGMAGDARFSRAEADMEAIIAAANAERPSKRNLATVGQEATKASYEKLKGLTGATAGHTAMGVLLDAMPLNQMVNAYDRLFGGTLAKFARRKRAKAAEHNRTLTAEQDYTYRGAGEPQTVKTSPRQLSDTWGAFKSRHQAKATALDWLNRESTLYRIWPEKPWAEQGEVYYAEAGFTEAERRQAYDQVRQLWQAVGKEGQGLFRQAQAVYDRTWSDRFAALAAEISRATGVPQLLPDGSKNPVFTEAHGRRIDSALNKLKAGPYSPLQRYGEFLVTVRDDQGKVVWFSGHETIEEANRTSADLKAGDFAGEQYRVTGATQRQGYDWRLSGIDQGTIHSLENMAETVNLGSAEATKGLREELRRALVETYLQSLPQSSFLSHANRRKNTKGATLDSYRAFNDYTVKAARSIASLKHDGEISSLLADLQKVASEAAADPNGTNVLRRQQVVEAVKAQHSASVQMEQNKVADALSQAGFLWFMSSPSQLFINSMQTFMVTLPRMAAAYGNSAGIRAVKASLAQYAKSRGDLLGENSTLDKNGPAYQVLEELRVRGTLDFTLAHDMSGLANGESSAMSGHWRKVLEVAGWAMHKSEVLNRQVAALASAQMELQQRNHSGPLSPEQLSDVADIAEDMVITSQFDYSQPNKPKIMQGPWRKVIFQFQQYRVNMLAMMAKDIRDSMVGTATEKASARRALSWQLGTQLALTGAAGTVLAPLAFAIADMFRDDDDLLDSRTEFVRAAPQILAHGLLSGVIDTSRVGADSLISMGGNYAPADATAKELFQYYVLQNIGPWAGLGANVFTGVEKALDGDHVGAVKNLAPAGIRDVYRAYFEATGGAKDSRQVTYFEPGMWDTVATVAGLKSGDRRQVEELRGASYEATTKAYTLKQRYLGRLALGYATGDQDMITGAETKMEEFNAKYPDLAITGRDRAQSIIRRIRTEDNAADTGIATARPVAESIRQQIGL